MSLFEQMSNIAGDVERLVSTKEKYDQGIAREDHSGFYLDKVRRLADMTVSDPKNTGRGPEILDEIREIERYRNAEVSKEYILRYWDQYTRAIS